MERTTYCILILISSFVSSIYSQTNTCASPTNLAVNSSCSTTAFTVGQNGTGNEDVIASCATGTNYSDGWFTVTGTGNPITITITNSNVSACLAAFSSCAAGQLACQMVAAGAAINNSINFNSTLGTTYYIQIDRRGYLVTDITATNQNNRDLTGDICAVSVPPAPANDLICNAVSVTCGNTYVGTTVNSTTTGETGLPACASTSPTAGGVWYVFTGDGSTVTASLCAGTAYDSKLNVYTGTCASISSCVASNDDGCSTQSTVTFGTSVGTNYYILVNGYSSATGAFSLAITCCTPGAPTCATLNSPANGATGVTQCSSLAWTAPAMGGCGSVSSYDVYYGTVNPPPFYVNTTSTSVSVTSTPSTVYYWQIIPKNGSGSASGCGVFSFTSAAGGNPQYTMVDDATSASPYNCVQLTTATNSQRGCAWDVNSTLNFTANFSYDFTVNLGNSDAGADGMAFVMQNDPLGRCKCGSVGGALGAGGITNSVVVELDTYINYEDRDDFNTSFIGCSGPEDPDHLDIWFNGNINPDLDGNCDATGAGERPATPTAVRLQNGGSNYNIENGSNHILRISWNAGTSTLTAKVMNTALTITYGTISSTFNPLTVFGTNTPYFGFTASTGGLNNNQSFCNPSILLPVELMSFNSYCYENYRKIYWSTASENNNAYFTLEKSANGVDFEFIQDFPSNGYKQTVTNYEYTDLEVTNKIEYYRLSQTDQNGVTKVFDIISSNCFEAGNLMTIENISQSEEQISITVNCLDDKPHVLSMIDQAGRLIKTIAFDSTKGYNQLHIDRNMLAKGLYIVKLAEGTESITRKFILQ